MNGEGLEGAPASSITVVSGLPRSGTSLMMQMLESAGLPILHDAKRAADASNPRGYYEYEAVKSTRRDAAWVSEAPGRVVKVIHALLSSLPRDQHYRVILMQRDLAQVVASQDAMLARLAGEPDPSLPSARLIEIYREQLDEARALLEREACFDWIAIDYPELVRAPDRVAGAVATFLELDVDPRRLAAVVEPALHRCR